MISGTECWEYLVATETISKSMTDLMCIDTAYAQACQKRAERTRERQRRYEQRNPQRQSVRRGKRADKYFIMWDGEAPQDTGYSLFGSSEGHEVCNPHLSTEDCLDLLLDAKREHPNGIMVMFGSRYDFDEICRASMPATRLAMLKWNGHVHWHGYRIQQAESKFFKVSKDGTSVTIYEIASWFHKKYTSALRDYGFDADCWHEHKACKEKCICTCDICRMESDKNRRGEFTWSEIGEIRDYMRQELKYGPLLMDKVRTICHDAGFRPQSWYGPSALALEALRNNHVRKAMAETPEAVRTAAQYAYAGGRFESFRGGRLGAGYAADKNSAYMAAAIELPNLANGEWRHSTSSVYEPGKFAVYHIFYQAPVSGHDPLRPYPLFRRYANGNVAWPRRVDGWYWSPEAELVKDDPYATFLEAWIFDESSCERPFSFVRDLYNRRLVLKNLGPDNPSREAQKALKWCLASIYGQLARRVGYDKRHNTAPRYHQLEWAGYITSRCRADMYRVAYQAYTRGTLVSIDTDSVTSLAPIEVDYGDGLGQWESSTFDGGLFFQSGVYLTYDYGTGGEKVWKDSKARGMEQRRGKPAITPDLLERAIDTGAAIRLAPKRNYTTVRMALAGNLASAGEWRDRIMTLHFGGDGKRYHNAKWCHATCPGDGSHVFLPRSQVTPDIMTSQQSVRHELPWIDGKRNRPLDKELATDTFWFDPSRIDSDDAWLAALVREHDLARVPEMVPDPDSIHVSPLPASILAGSEIDDVSVYAAMPAMQDSRTMLKTSDSSSGRGTGEHLGRLVSEPGETNPGEMRMHDPLARHPDTGQAGKHLL
jgi:hypothetical protein